LRADYCPPNTAGVRPCSGGVRGPVCGEERSWRLVSSSAGGHWANTAGWKRRYSTASVVTADQIVFNIKGNAYRLEVSVDFEKRIVWIKWLGTHQAYEKIM
jgi:mRNA-degrading endonuclease HigB of HigAB toxin-antitoxin module